MKGAFEPGGEVSAFPPIGDYAFLSDCEATALIAPSGNVEWMCLPRMDSPSAFGSILDRDAGSFRVAPADVNVPAARRYIPGTMVLETSWETRMGWVIVRDALSIGPWHHQTERSRSHRRSPTDHEADHVMLRLIECVQGSVEIKLECEPAFDYGGLAADWSYPGSGYGEALARSEGIDLELRLFTDLRLGFEGPRARARTTLHEGDAAFVALGWSEHPVPTELRGGGGVAGTDRALLAGVAQARRVPGPSVARVSAAQRADVEGPYLCPIGRDDRGGHNLPAGDARRGPQLGLPLQLDSRLDVHALGAVHARLR